MRMRLVFFIIFGVFCLSKEKVEPPRNPSSAKECAICHFRWIDTFFIDGDGTDLVELQIDPVAASAFMCFSCHDGSIGDAREKLLPGRGHVTGEAPPKGMNIPEEFPLDKHGRVQCATCHSPHSVSSEAGVDESTFLRAHNKDSKMCLQCHGDMGGGLAEGNHPLGQMERAVPASLLGKRESFGSKYISCETCHSAHGPRSESLLKKTALRSELCLECHADKNPRSAYGDKKPFHPINVKPVTASIPRKFLNNGAKLGRNGVLTCLTCHKVHNNHNDTLLVVKQDHQSSFCFDCHGDKKDMSNSKHDLMAEAEKKGDQKLLPPNGICSACHLPHKAARGVSEPSALASRLCLDCHEKDAMAANEKLLGYSHPVNVALDRSQVNRQLPLFSKRGFRQNNGQVACATCHDPHAPSSQRSFLRAPLNNLCGSCHTKQQNVLNTKHDLSKVAPSELNLQGQNTSESGVCGSCHLVHSKGLSPWAKKPKEGQICLSCHQRGAVAEKMFVGEHSHPMDVTPAEMKSPLPLFSDGKRDSKKGKLACATCHDPHNWSENGSLVGEAWKVEGDARNSFLRLSASPSPNLCTNCHQKEGSIENTEHDLLAQLPEEMNAFNQTPIESGICGVCHVAHNSPYSNNLWARGLAPPFLGNHIMDMMCNNCHSPTGPANEKVPNISSHPASNMVDFNKADDHYSNPFPLFDYASGEQVQKGNISCASCHNVHQWKPGKRTKREGSSEGNALNSFLRTNSASLPCKQCHGPDSLYRYKYFHNLDARPKHHDLGLPEYLP